MTTILPLSADEEYLVARSDRRRPVIVEGSFQPSYLAERAVRYLH